MLASIKNEQLSNNLAVDPHTDSLMGALQEVHKRPGRSSHKIRKTGGKKHTGNHDIERG
jgi:hypothetical protein